MQGGYVPGFQPREKPVKKRQREAADGAGEDDQSDDSLAGPIPIGGCAVFGECAENAEQNRCGEKLDAH